MRSPEVLTRPRSSAQGSQTFGFPPYAIVGRDDHFDWLSYKFAKASTHSITHPPLLSGTTHRGKGVDRELRKSEDATHLATDGPAPRRQDGYLVCVWPSLSGVKSPTRSSVTASSNLRRARRTSTAPSVEKPGGQLLCSAHTLCTVDTAYCAAATAVTAMGSPSLALSHLCWCGLCERHCSATAGTLITVRPWV